ncbi:MAG: LEA type 2 family protein [Thiomargarita sp.]|nr:LEA type 2 family protein [Thiomargarita sp.]
MKLYKHIQYLVIALLITACNGNLPIQQLAPLAPKVSLSNLTVKNMNLTQQDYSLQLRLENPNPVPLPINSLDYKLQLNDKVFTQGETKKSITIPANGEAFIDLDTSSNIMDVLGWGSFSNILTQKFNYKLSGNVNIIEGGPKLPFEYSDEIGLMKGK